jgi:hypothetical protein
VLGIVGAFDTLSRGAAPDHRLLASNISLALVTTLLGLIVAIPCMALFTFFRNRIDACAAEASAEIERLLLHLETVAQSPAAVPPPPPRSTFAPRVPSPSPQPAPPPPSSAAPHAR